MAEDDLGAALTGALDLSPQSRSALLAFGLQAMQPQAIGQTGMGHLGQALGAAGETITRQEQMDLVEEEKLRKLQAVQDKIDIARMQQEDRERNTAIRGEGLGIRERVAEQLHQLRTAGHDLRERDLTRRERRDARSGDQRDRGLDQRDRGLGIGQQNADTRQENAGRARGGITDAMRQRDLIRQQDQYEKDIDKQAKFIYEKSTGDIVSGKTGPYGSWHGKSKEDIAAALKLQKPFVPQQRFTPPPPDDEDEDETVTDPNETPATPAPRPQARPATATPPTGAVATVPATATAVAPTAPKTQAPLTSSGSIPTGAIDKLKANPGSDAQFDAIFGTGSAARVRQQYGF